MRFTPDMAAAFGDWLERDRIRDALVAARPDLAELLALDQQRPLLRIARAAGRSVIIARMAAGEPTPWIVGVVGASEAAAVPAPALHEVGAADEVTALVLDLLAPPGSAPTGSARSGAATPGAGARELGADERA